MSALISWVTGNSRAVLATFAVATIVLGFFAARVRIESSIESTLPSGDPQVRFYDEVRETFGSDEIGVVGLRCENLFSAGTLKKIQRITSALEEIEGVEKVISLTNAVDPSQDAFNPPPLILQIPPTESQRAALVRLFETTPIYAINLVAPDLRGTAINIFFENLTDSQYVDLRIDEQIRRIVETESGPEQLFYTGSSHIKQEATASMQHDLYVFTPAALLLLFATLWLSFRRLRAVVAPIFTVVAALLWTLGVMGIAEKSINLGTFILPPLLLVIGSSYAIHVLAQYYECLASETDNRAALRLALMRVWSPLAISAGTTVIGFGALAVNRITAIRELGIFSVVGVVFLAIACLALLPAILALWGGSPRARTAAPPQSSGLRASLSALGSRAYDSRSLVLIASLAVAVAAGVGLRQIRVDSDFLGYFDPDSRVRSDNEAINQEIVGSNPFYLVIESDAPGTLERWDVLKKIKELQKFLTTLPGVTGSISIVDYLELIERGSLSGDEDFTIDEDGNLIPFEKPKPFWEDPTSLVPLLNLIRKNASSFSGVITPDFAKGNILVRTSLSGSRATEATLDAIRAHIAHTFPGNLHVTPTGTLVLMTGTTSEIVVGQIRSLSLALLAIFAAMSLMFLSVRVGLLAILPNALAIAVFYGLLGWLGIYLNLGTSLIATIALGIAVDSTIHFMTGFARNARRQTDQRAALAATMAGVGVPVVFTTVALLLGFLTFAASSFIPIRQFGQLTAMTLGAALIANIILLPALLATTRIITLWDLVGLKLGEDPTKTVPLLAGLRPTQARVVILMGKIKRFADGEAIFRQGEKSRDMYVILDGRTDVYAADGQQRRKIAEMHLGDAFGEMALVRQGERSADVLAVGDVETLVIDPNFLERLQRRYPRIASRVLTNMTRILSDRLQNLTQRYVASD